MLAVSYMYCHKHLNNNILVLFLPFLKNKKKQKKKTEKKKQKTFVIILEMPFSIPTFMATRFVKHSTLLERRNLLKKSYRNQYIFVSMCSLYSLLETSTKKK